MLLLYIFMTDSLSLCFFFFFFMIYLSIYLFFSILNLSDTLYKLTYIIIATVVVNFKILIPDFLLLIVAFCLFVCLFYFSVVFVLFFN